MQHELNGKSWYLVLVKVRQHEKAFRNLIAQDFECLSPLEPAKEEAEKDVTTQTQPRYLFPGYIFIRLEASCNWCAISSTRGVIKVLRFGAFPVVVPEEDIVKIRNYSSLKNQALSEHELIEPGDLVKINAGGCAELDGIFKCAFGKDRSIVLVSYLSRQHEIRIKRNMMQRAI